MNSEFQFGTIKGKFTFLLGKVRVSSDFKIVRTGKLSLVDITYDDGSIIRIFQDSIIDLERISWALSDALELRRFESSGTGYLLCLILCYLGIHTSIMKMLIDKFFKLILDAYMEVYKDKKTAAREFQEFFRYARAMGPIKLFGRILVFLATGKFPIIFRIKISPDRYLGRKW
ncbi:hypothetical protein GTN66_05915, partial [bacterium]|nr:hypothetical protein [bacterium]NIO73935.1 hypothetical protein [bacterium]